MVKDTKTEEIKQDKKPAVKDYIHAVGRRREAVARVRLYASVSSGLQVGDQVVEKGHMYINNQPIEQYFPGDVAKDVYSNPFRITNTLGKFSATIKVAGGGKSGQLGAVVLGLSRALADYDREKFRAILKKKGLLMRDARVRERRKIGRGGKARRKKQSPKR